MSKLRLVCAATLVLAVCSHLSAYTLFVSSNWEPYRIEKWDPATGTCVNSFTTGATLNWTKDMAIGPDGNLYVANRGTAQVLRFNASTGAYLGVFAAAPPRGQSIDPQTLEFGPDGNLYIGSQFDGRVLKYNGATGAFMSTLVSGVNKSAGMQFGPDGNLYVSSFDDNAVYKFNPTTGANLGVFASVSQPEEIRFGPDGNLYVASYLAPGGGGVFRFNGQTGEAMGRFVSRTAAYGLQFAPDGDLYVSSYVSSGGIFRFDGETGAFKDVVKTADGTWAAGGYILITPEPGTIVLLALGGGLLLRRRSRAARAA